MKTNDDPTPPAPAPPPGENPPPPPWFQFCEKTLPTVRVTAVAETGVLRNGPLATVAFDDLRAESQGESAERSAVTATALELPAEVLSKDGLLGYTLDVRGSCSKTPGCRATVMIEVGGLAHTRTFDYEEAGADSWMARIFSFERRLHKDAGPAVVPLVPLTINVLLSVERRTSEDRIVLSVDSIDVTATRP